MEKFVGPPTVLGSSARMSEPLDRFQILALSGGGFRGLYTAKVLADIEESIGAPVATRFDLLAGTSIGGILALALALEIPAAKMVRMFEKQGGQIFKRRFSLGGYLRAPYTQASLGELLRSDDLFGLRTLGSCKHPVIVPAINYTTGRPVVFKTPHHHNFLRDHKHLVADVALATSAAPGYFPRHVFGNSQYIDGGLFANAPGLLGVHRIGECALAYLSRRALPPHALDLADVRGRYAMARVVVCPLAVIEHDATSRSCAAMRDSHFLGPIPTTVPVDTQPGLY
jgi:patatin-like phospholipase/acyl hydrolase